MGKRWVSGAVFAGLLALGNLAHAADWTIDLSHSALNWAVDHMMVSETTGNFKTFSGTITNFDGTDASKAVVEVSIDAASIDSDNKDRDDHLRSPDFFDVAQFPTATFKSTKIEKGKGKNAYTVTGDFTMHGVTKKITFPMTYRGTVTDPWGNTRAGFVGDLTLNRKDYGLVWNKSLDAGGVAVGDEVRIQIKIEAIQKKAEAPKP